MTTSIDPTLRDLFPSLSDQDLLAAQANLERYTKLLSRVYERVRTDAEGQRRMHTLLTAPSHLPYDDEADSP